MQYTQLSGSKPLSSYDLQYTAGLLKGLYSDLDQIINKNVPYTTSKAKLIADKVMLVTDLQDKLNTVGGLNKILSDNAIVTSTLETGRKVSDMIVDYWQKFTALIPLLESKEIAQETAAESFPAFYLGLPFRLPPQMIPDSFLEPSVETVARMNYPFLKSVVIESGQHVYKTQEYRDIQKSLGIPVVDEIAPAEKGLPILAIVAGATALYFLNK